jgi:hypothetical protein
MKKDGLRFIIQPRRRFFNGALAHRATVSSYSSAPGRKSIPIPDQMFYRKHDQHKA